VPERKRAGHRRPSQGAKNATQRRSATSTRASIPIQAHRGARRRTPARVNLDLTRRRRRLLVRVLLGGMVVVALLFAFVFPARTLLAQRQQTQKERDRLELLREQTRKLEAETRRLQNDAEIERIARERYNFVRPGERPYVVVPPPTTAPPAPATTTPAPPSSKP
jgi:cell division protein FtsB